MKREFVTKGSIYKKLSGKPDLSDLEKILPEAYFTIGFYEFVVYYMDEVKTGRFESRKLFDFREDLKKEADRLLEVRVFNQNKEYYLFRGEEGFVGRVKEDTTEDGILKRWDGYQLESFEVFDELHKVWNRCKPERLKKEDKVFIRVRNYFSSNGRLRFLDWRFVAFENRDAEPYKS